MRPIICSVVLLVMTTAASIMGENPAPYVAGCIVIAALVKG